MRERYLFLSDIHSNYPALRSVFKKSERFGPFKAVLCTGDIVGYGVFPNECVEAMRSMSVIVRRGNHDRAVALGDAQDFNPLALWVVKHNQRVLTSENMEYLKGLTNAPYVDPQGRFAMVHGSFAGSEKRSNTGFRIFRSPVDEMFEDIYILNPADAVDAMAAMHFVNGEGEVNVPLGNVGHTHQPMTAIADIEYSGEERFVHDLRMQKFTSVAYTNDGIVLEASTRSPLENGRFQKLLFNFGSVGQPRHGSPNACYGIVEFDDEIVRVIFRHTEYDLEETQAKMREEGFPEPLIDRLEYGR